MPRSARRGVWCGGRESGEMRGEPCSARLDRMLTQLRLHHGFVRAFLCISSITLCTLPRCAPIITPGDCEHLRCQCTLYTQGTELAASVREALTI